LRNTVLDDVSKNPPCLLWTSDRSFMSV